MNNYYQNLYIDLNYYTKAQSNVLFNDISNNISTLKTNFIITANQVNIINNAYASTVYVDSNYYNRTYIDNNYYD